MFSPTKCDRSPLARTALVGALALADCGLVACTKREPAEKPPAPFVPPDAAPARPSMRSAGPDDLLALAKAWVAEHDRLDPSMAIEVAGGATEAGITALLKGTAELAFAHRKMTAEEAATFARANGGKAPRETVGAFEALCVYVNGANPLDTVTVEQLRQLYREGGRVTKWADLGVKRLGGPKGAAAGKLARLRVSPVSDHFREALLGEGATEKVGTLEMNDVDAVIAMVAASPDAIACAPCRPTAAAKVLKITGDPGAAVAPTTTEIGEGRYPLARPVLIQTAGTPSPPVQRYLDWLLSETGQQVVERAGYVRGKP
jgi:phosphate transport system substrate-binding protein